MKTKRLIMSTLVLLALGVSACNVLPVTSGDDSSDNSSESSSDSSSTSSDQGQQGHVHTFERGWRTNDTHHWHVCTGTLENGQPCTETSGYAEHVWANPEVITPPGPTTPGKMKYKCSVCFKQKIEEIEPAGEKDGEFTFNETALNTPQEIHSASQKAYLNYTGDYYNITSSQLSSFGMEGNKNISASEQVQLSWTYTVPTGKSVTGYYVVYGQKSDLSDGFQTSTTNTNSIKFYNPYLGDNYFKVYAVLNDGSIESSQIKIFKVATQAPRNIYCGNLPNVRDMGGRTTYAGGKIKQGLIYRGAGHNFDQRNTSVNAEGKDVILNQLKIKTEINVANGTGNNLSNSGVNVTSVKDCFMDYGSTPYSNLSRNAERIRQVMDILADESNYPVFYHCRIGTDRTGITGMMIGGLLGIKFNEIFQDYVFSNFSPIDGQRYANKPDDPNGDDPAKYIEEIKKMPGATYQEKTYNALLSIGCKAATLNKIIDFMTEGNKANIPTTYKVGIGNGLSSDGSKKTANDYKNPDVYYQVGSGKKVSYTATTTAGDKNVVVYLGSTDSSNSTKLASCITLKIDGVEQTIVDKTLFLAGFGTTGQNSRTGYMFNILGKYTLTAASHTFEISVKSGTFFVGTIDVFDYVAEAQA